jgi:hypothetical protein
MVNLKEVDSYIVDFIRINPGRMAHLIVPHVATKFGLKPKTVSERLKALHEDKQITIRDGRFYPAKEEFTPEKHDFTAMKEELISRDETTFTPVKNDFTPEKQEAFTPEKEEFTPEKYLLVYDLKYEPKDNERRTIYNRLNKVYHRILQEGRFIVRIQQSVWITEKKEDALMLASYLPDNKAKIKIFKILEEL